MSLCCSGFWRQMSKRNSLCEKILGERKNGDQGESGVHLGGTHVGNCSSGPSNLLIWQQTQQSKGQPLFQLSWSHKTSLLAPRTYVPLASSRAADRRQRNHCIVDTLQQPEEPLPAAAPRAGWLRGEVGAQIGTSI